jgi:hypothetical protein
MLRHMALVRTEVSEENIASIIRVTRIGELGPALAVTINRSKLLVYTTTLSARRNCPSSKNAINSASTQKP